MLQEHAADVARMKARLAQAGDQAPPWYQAPELSSVSTAQLGSALCAAAHQAQGVQPIDYCPGGCPPVPPSPSPSPHPPGPGKGKTITKAACDKADGILNKFGNACCPKECGACGGGGCNKLKGGEKNCCTHAVEGNDRPCATSKAPCHG